MQVSWPVLRCLRKQFEETIRRPLEANIRSHRCGKAPGNRPIDTEGCFHAFGECNGLGFGYYPNLGPHNFAGHTHICCDHWKPKGESFEKHCWESLIPRSDS